MCNWVIQRSHFRKCYYGILMLSPMIIFVSCLLIVYVFSLLSTVTAAIEAPIGYEDADGFHYGLHL